ncbi:Hypothetical protein SCLAV_0493 [Streptomyces clavuligerus]|uniref:Uncharacterized protein n=1 Tax=Streptomyces clavuligerus TaxID=1901 RepID=E2Q9E9_STRCL|nr:Hypothetical protein SCLAV_0493 [Streptomyces clavuligerus]
MPSDARSAHRWTTAFRQTGADGGDRPERAASPNRRQARAGGGPAGGGPAPGARSAPRQMISRAAAPPTDPSRVKTGMSTFSSTQLPARKRSAFGGPTGYQRLPAIGIGHSTGHPETVSASPMSWTRAPSTMGSPSHRYSCPGAVNSQSEPPSGPSSTPARIQALVAPSSQTRMSLETRAARQSSPSTARTRWTKRMASTAQRPPATASAEAPAPIITAHTQVWVRVRCPPVRRLSPGARVAR